MVDTESKCSYEVSPFDLAIKSGPCAVPMVIYIIYKHIRVESQIGKRIVKDLVDAATKHSEPNKYQFYFDNFFTSYKPLKEPREQDI